MKPVSTGSSEVKEAEENSKNEVAVHNHPPGRMNSYQEHKCLPRNKTAKCTQTVASTGQTIEYCYFHWQQEHYRYNQTTTQKTESLNGFLQMIATLINHHRQVRQITVTVVTS